MKIGAMIRKFRIRRKISIHDLCDKSKGKISPRTLARIEYDDKMYSPRLETLLAIREAFGFRGHSSWLKNYLEDPVLLYRTEQNPLKTTPFIIAPTNRTLNRIGDVTDPRIYAVEINSPVGIDWVKAGWTFFVSPSAEIRDGDLVLNFNSDGGAHLHEEKSQYQLQQLDAEAKERAVARRKKLRVEKVIAIKPK